jgi:hypothetical protein
MLAVLLPRSQIASFNVHYCTWQKVGPQTHTDDVLSAVHLPLLMPQHALSNLECEKLKSQVHYENILPSFISFPFSCPVEIKA